MNNNKSKYNRANYLNNRSELLAKQIQYYANNRAERIAYQVKYYADRPWLTTISAQTNKLRRTGLYNQTIQESGLDKYSLDHMIPVSKFNVDETTSTEILELISDPRNVQAITVAQNKSKHARIDKEYIPSHRLQELHAYANEMVNIGLLNEEVVKELFG